MTDATIGGVARTISYADAVRLLGGGPESAVYQRVNTMTGGLLAGAAIAAPQLLALLDLRTELARVSGELVTTTARAMAGSGRRDRTDRLVAAHTIIVIAAYFDALSDVDLSWAVPLPKPGLSVGGAGLSRADQLRLAGQGAEGARDLTSAALRAGAPTPEPHIPNEKYLAALEIFYDRLTADLGRFLSGLAPFDELSEGERTILLRDLEAGGRRARKRYEEMLLNLMVDCPDMALWIDHRHRNAIEQAGLARPSSRASSGSWRGRRREHRRGRGQGPPTGARRPARAQDRQSDRPAGRAGACPPWTAGTSRTCQVAERVDGISPADEASAGHRRPPRLRRLPRELPGYPAAAARRCSSSASPAPASRCSPPSSPRDCRPPTSWRYGWRCATSHLPRLQHQIEQAIRRQPGDHVARPGPRDDAVPVIMLDGFDELLQATGVDQSDFLQVAPTSSGASRRSTARRGDRHESGRVADRARLPPEALLPRLEPFDEPPIRGWWTPGTS